MIYLTQYQICVFCTFSLTTTKKSDQKTSRCVSLSTGYRMIVLWEHQAAE